MRGLGYNRFSACLCPLGLGGVVRPRAAGTWRVSVTSSADLPAPEPLGVTP